MLLHTVSLGSEVALELFLLLNILICCNLGVLTFFVHLVVRITVIARFKCTSRADLVEASIVLALDLSSGLGCQLRVSNDFLVVPQNGGWDKFI
jgi:hypothetical protein